MAVQGHRSRWKPNGTSRVSERDKDIFAPRDLVYGSHEGMMALFRSDPGLPDGALDEGSCRGEVGEEGEEGRYHGSSLFQR